jgi:glucose-6-phosphate-specific signal transduction histidine kinase
MTAFVHLEERGAGIATHLAERRERIIHDYELALRESGNAIARTHTSLRQCLDQARRIIDDTVQELRGPSGPHRDVFLSQEIGTARAVEGTLPSELLRAAATLFSLGTQHLAEYASAQDVSWEDIGTAISVFNDCLLGRLRECLFSYAGFLLTRIDEERTAERRRVSRDIHDLLGHELALIQQHLELFDLYLSDDPESAARWATAARERLRKTIDRLPWVIQDLRSSVLEQDLRSALLDYAATVGTSDVTVTVRGAQSMVPPHMLGQAFLTVREALRNALTHADPKHVRIVLEIAPHELVARIEDDGRGFDLQDVTARPVGSGLASMQERAALLGGALRIWSRPGSGTHIELFIPLLEVPDTGGI